MAQDNMVKEKVTVGKLFDVNTYHIGSGNPHEWKIKEKKIGQHYKLSRDGDEMVFKIMVDGRLHLIVEVTFNGLTVHHCPIDAYGLEEKHRAFFASLQDKFFEVRSRINGKKKERFNQLFTY